MPPTLYIVFVFAVFFSYFLSLRFYHFYQTNLASISKQTFIDYELKEMGIEYTHTHINMDDPEIYGIHAQHEARTKKTVWNNSYN